MTETTDVQKDGSGYEMPEMKKKSRGRKRIILVSVVLASLIVVIFIYMVIFRTDPHYKLGIKHLEAKNFVEAEAEFRLCLQNRPANVKAKGLLAYSIVRDLFTDSDKKPEELYDECLMAFLVSYAQFESDDMIKQIVSKDIREWTDKRIKDHHKEVREAMKKKRIPFRDWIEFKLAAFETARTIYYKLPQEPDDDFDALFKDIAAAILSRSGDKNAMNYLVERCSVAGEKTLTLTLVAGDKCKEHLGTEMSRKGSFIESEGSDVLRRLELVQALRDFITAHPDIRRMKKSDLPKGEEDVYKDMLDFKSQWFYEEQGPIAYYAFGGVDNQLLLNEAINKSKFDPSAVSVTERELEDNRCLAIIGGFDAKVRNYVCRILLWDSNEWHTLGIDGTSETGNELIRKCPTGYSIAVNDKTTKIAIPVRRMGEVTRTRQEDRLKPVTRYREEYRYNPRARWNSFWERWEGAYEWVNVPYTTNEYVTQEVEYKQTTAGNRWEIFKLNLNQKTLIYDEAKWEEYGSPF